MTRERRRMEAEQIDAELLMAKEFLRQPGTDPAAWIDGARQRLQRLIAALRETPAAVPSPEMPVIEVDDVVRLASGHGQEIGVMEALILNGLASKAHIATIERPRGVVLWERRP